jgi:hypothetical protein
MEKSMTETVTSEEGTGETHATPKPEKEHDWLHRLIGDWDFTGECFMGTDQPPMKSTGEFTVRSIGGLWVQCEGISDALNGTPVPSVMTLGYDPQKGRFVGSFVAACMTRLWIYEGSFNAARNELTLETEGPSFADDGTLVPYQDVIAIESDDHWTLNSRAPGEDGGWFEFMTAHYRRKK